MKKMALFGVLSLCSVIVFAEGLTTGSIIWTGGVSDEERALAPKDGTKLVFFVKSGSYLANVRVIVTNAAGNTVVDTVTTGPWLYLNLPAGQYKVRAELPDGRAQGVTFEAADGREVGLAFPDEL